MRALKGSEVTYLVNSRVHYDPELNLRTIYFQVHTLLLAFKVFSFATHNRLVRRQGSEEAHSEAS